MFWKKKCPSCGKPIKDEWNFCPYCGEPLKEMGIEEEMEREFRKIERTFRIPKFGFGGIKGGITITIKNLGEKPSIEVRPLSHRVGVEKKEEKSFVKHHRIPKKIVDPKIDMKMLPDGRRVFVLNLDGVKSLDDVEVRKLRESIEVKAYAKDMAYFKVIPVPPTARIIKKDLKKGVLTLEVMP